MYRTVACLLSCLSWAQSANILGVFLVPSISHQIVFQPIWRELSLRGHNVTVVTPDPLNDPSLTNLTEISVSSAYDFFKAIKVEDVVLKEQSEFQILVDMFYFMDAVAETELNNPQVRELIADESKHFDLILIEWLHPVMYGFAGRFKAPVIGVSSLGVSTTIYDMIGNPTHSVLYPDLFLNLETNELTLWHKFKSVAFSLWSNYYYHYVVVPRAHQMAKKYFGQDIAYVGDLQKNQSLLFVNVNPLVYPPRANVPAIVELGLMHIKPIQSLPKDLKQILDEATEGVVYFSLGSNVKSVNLVENLRKTITGALGELPYKVLWKWESDHLPGKPDNVVIRQWLPQQDLLAHPNVKVFVTQGGLQSTEEAISRGVPLVGLPFFGDQPMNVLKIAEWGIGLRLDPTTVTKDELKKAIIEVAENSKYKKRIKEVRDLIFDKPMTGLEKAIWWSEYVIRHKGAQHLRSPSADISWFHYYFVDLALTVVAITTTIVFVFHKLINLTKASRSDKLKVQ